MQYQTRCVKVTFDEINQLEGFSKGACQKFINICFRLELNEAVNALETFILLDTFNLNSL